jgi:hypothetical protein
VRWLVAEQAEQAAYASTASTSEAVPAATLAVDVQRRMAIGMERAAIVVVPLVQLDSGTCPGVRELALFLSRSSRQLIRLLVVLTLREGELSEPFWESRQFEFVQTETGEPAISFSCRVHAWGSDNDCPGGLELDSGRQLCRGELGADMSKPEMASISACSHGGRSWESSPVVFEAFERRSAIRSRIYVEYREI